MSQCQIKCLSRSVQAHMSNTYQTNASCLRRKTVYLKSTFSSLQLSFSPSTPMNSHVRVLCLLVSLLLDCCGLAVVCGLLGASHGMHTLSFMAAEVRTILTMLSRDDCGHFIWLRILVRAVYFWKIYCFIEPSYSEIGLGKSMMCSRVCFLIFFSLKTIILGMLFKHETKMALKQKKKKSSSANQIKW